MIGTFKNGFGKDSNKVADDEKEFINNN